MIDRYWWGSVERISPEAPVPVVKVEKTNMVAGGAANVAANVAGLGAKVSLAGAIGTDAEGKEIKKILKQNRISSEFVLQTKNRPTTMKTRVVAHSQHVVRIDQEKIEGLSQKDKNNFVRLITPEVSKFDVILISDYAKGFLSQDILHLIINECERCRIPVVIDPKGKDFTKYGGATILTPNKKEALESAGIVEEVSDLSEESVKKAGMTLLEKSNLKSLLITLGEEGMTLFQAGKDPVKFRALARQVYDVTGAGDTVIATLGTAIGAGADLQAACRIANTAAGFVVEEVGTTIITQEKLLQNS